MTDAAPDIPEIPTRVLVLDDEEPIRNLVSAALTQNGFAVDTADDGRTGLRLLLQKDFDVAVIDLRMRDMGGAEFLEQASSIWPWLGIVILSGFADDASRAHAARFGVTRILDKPMRVPELVRNVREEALGKKRVVEFSASQSFVHMQDQLALLRRFSETALAAENLPSALRSLSAGLGNLVPCDLVGVLNIQSDVRELYLHALNPVSAEFAVALEKSMVGRYEALSGRQRPHEGLRVVFDPTSARDDAPREIGSMFAVPLVVAGEIQGLLALAAAKRNAYDSRHAALLYHAANQLSMVLVGLARMRQLAVRDALTGLYNRRGIEEEYERVWLMGRRYKWPVGVAVIDIDQFKPLNDTHGHPIGDEILVEFTQVVQRAARESDIIGRFGGDEIVVVLPQAGPADCLAFGERLLHALRQHAFCERSLGGIQIQASIGVASSTGAPDHSAAQLLAGADEALLEAKKHGKNQVRLLQAVPLRKGETTIVAPKTDAQAQRIRGRVLVVDDESSVATLLGRILTRAGYEVAIESTADGALNAVRGARAPFDIVLTDLNLPGKSGLELLDEMRLIDEALLKIVITGHATLDNAVTCLRRGAYDFIEKPVMPDQLTAIMDRALEFRRLKMENIRYQNHLEDMVREKSAALRTALDEVRSSYDFTLEAMAALLDARESSTAHHSTRVRDLSVILAKEIGLSATEIEELSKGALLHDIGKIGIPDAILLKPGPLTPEEREIMKRHPTLGYDLLKSSSYLAHTAAIVHAHHENFDGTGYPRGLKGDEIPLGARIFSVIDAYDAMRSDRVYRKAMSVTLAVAEIRRHAGTQFDPAVVEAFLRCHLSLEAAGRY